MASVPVFCRDFWAERKKAPGGVERRENPFRLLTAFAATLPLLSLRDIFPRRGEAGPQGDGFSSGGKLFGSAERRPLGGAAERSEAEGVFCAQKAPEGSCSPGEERTDDSLLICGIWGS